MRQGLKADESGLERGDVILEVNKKTVTTASEFEKELKNAKSGQVFLLYVYRDETYQFITLDIPEILVIPYSIVLSFVDQFRFSVDYPPIS